jgi:hypothetical protein
MNKQPVLSEYTQAHFLKNTAMNSLKESHPQWDRYSKLLVETNELEYEIIGLMSAALIRKEGDGEPNAEEQKRIDELKAHLNPKVRELEMLRKELKNQPH